MPTGLVVAFGVGLAVLLVALLVGLVVALRSASSMVESLGRRLVVVEHDAAQLRAVLTDVDADLDRVVDALGEGPSDPARRTTPEAPRG